LSQKPVVATCNITLTNKERNKVLIISSQI
jgi:hypothetical protein